MRARTFTRIYLCIYAIILNVVFMMNDASILPGLNCDNCHRILSFAHNLQYTHKRTHAHNHSPIKFIRFGWKGLESVNFSKNSRMHCIWFRNARIFSKNIITMWILWDFNAIVIVSDRKSVKFSDQIDFGNLSIVQCFRFFNRNHLYCAKNKNQRTNEDIKGYRIMSKEH